MIFEPNLPITCAWCLCLIVSSAAVYGDDLSDGNRLGNLESNEDEEVNCLLNLSLLPYKFSNFSNLEWRISALFNVGFGEFARISFNWNSDISDNCSSGPS